MAIDVYLGIVNDDAFENEFEIIIPTFPGCLDPVGVKFRGTKVTTPDLGFDEYEVHWKTEKAKKPSGKQNTEKTLTIEFRIDKNYQVYKSFENWLNFIHSHELGTASRDYVGGVSMIRVPITMLYLDANGIPTSSGEIYKGCYLNKVPSRNYTYESGNPIVLSYSFTYSSYVAMR